MVKLAIRRGAFRAAQVAMLSVALAANAAELRAHAPVGVTNTASTLAGARFWRNPASPAQKQADAWRRSRPADAALMQSIADVPTAFWLGGWFNDVKGEVKRITEQASREGATPVLVAYNIPHRDCGEYSAGGERNAGGYKKWIRDFAAGLQGKRSVVILEPDAVPLTRCLNEKQQNERFELLTDAVRVLKAARATVYIDAGNAKWMKADDVAARLQRAGIAEADGFALNVSNFIATSTSVAFGEQLSKRVGGKHFIIDTSRNGAGTANGQEWCNPGNQAVGNRPTTNTGHPLVDAYLWVKQPGESDGTCSGGPRAGEFWGDYALGLAKRGAVQLAAK